MTSAYRTPPPAPAPVALTAEAQRIVSRIYVTGLPYYPADAAEGLTLWDLRTAGICDASGYGRGVVLTPAGREVAAGLGRAQSIGLGRSGIPSG